ncbi:MAG: hypothetical protein NZ518_10400, partial [Dehalococcoidia bacterium]|nr:hypothetical protein [Dehalococcoidia bacterium]
RSGSARVELYRLFDTVDAIAANAYNTLEIALNYWEDVLQDGVYLPTGEIASIPYSRYFDVLEDPELRACPRRIERLLHHLFEIRSAPYRRELGLSQWFEDGEPFFGLALFDADRVVHSLRVVDEQTLNRRMLEGVALWRV